MSLQDELERCYSALSALNELSGQISGLISNVEASKSDLITNFNIDNKGLEEDNLKQVIEYLTTASGDITSTYIPQINQKITSLKSQIEAEEQKKREEEEKKNKEKEEEEEEKENS